MAGEVVPLMPFRVRHEGPETLLEYDAPYHVFGEQTTITYQVPDGPLKDRVLRTMEMAAEAVRERASAEQERLRCQQELALTQGKVERLEQSVAALRKRKGEA